jgi:hypothetical protein
LYLRNRLRGYQRPVLKIFSPPKEILMKNERKRRVLRGGMAISLVWLILCTPSISLGWGPGGHMMVAQIALARLNPKAKAQAKKLLAIKIDPTTVVPSPDFVNAAHWADDIRDAPGFGAFAELHFIDNPFSIDGTALPVLPTPNVVTALEKYVDILKTSTDPKAQAQALRFVIHFVGDIHQPLHCATRVDKNNPTGDRGGNQVSLKVNGKKVNLHSYWDGGIGSFPKGGGPPKWLPPALGLIPPAAALAMRGNPATDPKLKLSSPFDYQAWSDESFALAKTVTYKGMKNGVTPTAAYNSNALKVARKRVAWAGYRLAALLNDIWPG